MSKRCPKCGNLLMDNESFCAKCGENVISAADDAAGYKSATDNAAYANSGSYGVQQYQQPQFQQPQYGYAQPAPQADELSLGSWIGTIIVTTMFGIISIILLFVWGFGSTGPESRRRYCKAMLIVDLIMFVISLIFSLIFSAVFAAILREYWPQIVQFFRDNGIDVGSVALSLGNMFGM